MFSTCRVTGLQELIGAKTFDAQMYAFSLRCMGPELALFHLRLHPEGRPYSDS